MTLIDELNKDHTLQGRTLDRYHVGRQLGRGAFGRVYYATDTSLDRPVALKFLLPGDDGVYSEQYLSRFDTEAKLVSRLHGDTTVTLFDYGELDGVLYHAMEYVDGVTLSDRIERDGPLRPLDIARFLEQLLEALREAHHHGIIHRDIKPSNIMVYTHLGVEERVKLMDFGISRDMNHDGTKDTRTGQLVGTVRYMSPEQTRSYEVVTPRSDIYALGMVAYEMITGRSPFSGSMSQINILSNILTAPDIELEPGSWPEGLRHIVNKMLRKDPERRYADANAALADIRNLTKTPPAGYSGDWPYEGTPAPMDVPELARSAPERMSINKTTLVVVSAAAILLLGVGIIAAALTGEDTANPDDTLATSAVGATSTEPADDPPAAQPDAPKPVEETSEDTKEDLGEVALTGESADSEASSEENTTAPKVGEDHPVVRDSRSEEKPERRKRKKRRPKAPGKPKGDSSPEPSKPEDAKTDIEKTEVETTSVTDTPEPQPDPVVDEPEPPKPLVDETKVEENKEGVHLQTVD